MEKKRIGIIGGGISGAALGYYMIHLSMIMMVKMF